MQLFIHALNTCFWHQSTPITTPGVGVKPISTVSLFSEFFIIAKTHISYWISCVYIWQVSPQLSCDDTCQIWMWFKLSSRYCCKIANHLDNEPLSAILLTHKYLETHGCLVSIVATDALVLYVRPSVPTVHSASEIFVVLYQFHLKILHLLSTTLENIIMSEKITQLRVELLYFLNDINTITMINHIFLHARPWILCKSNSIINEW